MNMITHLPDFLFYLGKCIEQKDLKKKTVFATCKRSFNLTNNIV